MFIAIGDDPAWAALTAFRALIAPAGRISALQALDGLAAGASQRELAVALFGSSAVARGWQPDGALRAQVRYLIRRAQALMAGEYRTLIAAGPSASCSGGRAGHGNQAASHEV